MITLTFNDGSQSKTLPAAAEAIKNLGKIPSATCTLKNLAKTPSATAPIKKQGSIRKNPSQTSSPAVAAIKYPDKLGSRILDEYEVQQPNITLTPSSVLQWISDQRQKKKKKGEDVKRFVIEHKNLAIFAHSNEEENIVAMSVKKQDKKPEQKCRFCDVIFADGHSLNRHIIAAHIRDTKIGAKKVCIKKIKNFDEEKRLAKIQDAGAEIFLCDFCQKPFSSLRYKLAHEQRIHKEFTCQLCSMGFAESKYLTNHLKKIHLSSSCNNCQKNCNSSTEAKKFNLAVRAGALKFKCDVCEELFDRACILREHIAYAHKDKCKYCSKVLFNKKGLFSHMTSKHKNQLKFECSVCQKRFPKLKHLKTHQATREHDKS